MNVKLWVTLNICQEDNYCTNCGYGKQIEWRSMYSRGCSATGGHAGERAEFQIDIRFIFCSYYITAFVRDFDLLKVSSTKVRRWTEYVVFTVRPPFVQARGCL